MKLSALEIDIAKEIINIGLGKAADSLAFFTKQTVFIRSPELAFRNMAVVDSFSVKKPEENLYILASPLKGEIKGCCYFIFSEEEAKKLMDLCLPESLKTDPDSYKMMGEGLLLEIDNIITAAVITQFSNFFKFKMYGDVPALKILKAEKLTSFLAEQEIYFQYYLYFKTDFETKGININPEFVWFLDEMYFEGVSKVARDEKALSKILNERQ